MLSCFSCVPCALIRESTETRMCCKYSVCVFPSINPVCSVICFGCYSWSFIFVVIHIKCINQYFAPLFWIMAHLNSTKILILNRQPSLEKTFSHSLSLSWSGICQSGIDWFPQPSICCYFYKLWFWSVLHARRSCIFCLCLHLSLQFFVCHWVNFKKNVSYKSELSCSEICHNFYLMPSFT